MPLDYTILAPSVVKKLISRIAVPGMTIQRFLGFEEGGSRVEQLAINGLRQYTYDIFDNVRSIALGRAPGTGPGTVKRNPVGNNTVTIARSYEKMTDLNYEMLSNIRTIGESATDLDRKGIKYLEAQGKVLQQRQLNFREFLSWGMLRGGGTGYGFIFSGDDWIPVLTGAQLVIDWKIPAANKSQLNMLGAGDIIDTTWSNPAADIPGDLDGISIAFQNLVGPPLAWVMTDSIVWNHVMNNTAVKAQAGTSNTVYETFEMSGERAKDNSMTGLRYATLKARPWLKWFITDSVLEVNGTNVKYFQDGEASFGIDLAFDFCKMQEGSEWVKDSLWAPAVARQGRYDWIREEDQPAKVELHSINNIVPELTIPKALAFGDVLF